jgi:DNA polymerase-3 subunit gamma/tau
MSYQVLARKWRPQNFNQMVGQSHVLRALVNALDENRLHHAYLFTGTRGVGKTTIARIFAKSLNCEQGVSAQPCGQCRSCVEIAEGRHVDLIEVDAASRTKVEDTRELLDNVQYAPTRGRFKIYLIDEVHMLSGHSFNALLKTLEEPPPHVKFLFATTDPQKLPITILSRCLQFNLKRMPLEMISGHLAHVLQVEGIAYTDPALTLIARAADGSMRDALSLTDQAIVTGGGQIQAADVQDMLGLLPHEYLVGLIKAVLADDGQQLFAIIEQMAQLTTDFTAAADGLISLLHQIAVQQAVGLYAASAEIVELAQLVTPADTQLYYQLALHGRRDLALNPDPRSGFEMLLLRLMAFRVAEPIALTELAVIAPKKKQTLEPKLTIEQTVAFPEPLAALPIDLEPIRLTDLPVVAMPPVAQIPEPLAPIIPPWEEEHTPPTTEVTLIPLVAKRWHEIVQALNLNGMTLTLAQHCVLEQCSDSHIVLTLDQAVEDFYNAGVEAKLAQALRTYYQRELNLKINISAKLGAETPNQRLDREQAEKQSTAERSIREDAFVQTLQAEFGASIIPGSIQSLE